MFDPHLKTSLTWGFVTMSRFVDPLSDFGFKRLFGTEPTRGVLKSFLNSLLPERHQIESLTLHNSERLGLSNSERKAIFDIYCIGTNGERFIVELQKAPQRYYKDRSVFYSTFAIQQQAEVNEWNFRLDPIYSINILDFRVYGHEDHEHYLTTVELKDERNKVYYDKLKFIYLELPKFDKRLEDLSSDLEKWLYLFKNLESLHELPKIFPAEIVEVIEREAELATMTRKERIAYEETVKAARDNRNVMNYAIETATEKGLAQGLEQGLEKGLEQGLARGIKKGERRGLKRGTKKGRRQEKQQVAQRLLANGLPMGEVAGIVDLSVSELSALLEEE